MKVAIIMSTYNGELYVKQQIDSVLSQSYSEFKLFIRDDSSSDKTMEIIKSYNDPRIVILSDKLGNLGPKKSFVQILRKIRADVYLFCDQDDVWLKDKVLTVVNEFEDKSGLLINKPVLLHTDLVLVDKNLHPIGQTFHNYGKMQFPGDYSLKKLLVQNCAVGCTMAFNQSLLEKSGLICRVELDSLIMHDWWLALVAARFGLIKRLERVSIFYRQHGGNVCGISRSGEIFSRVMGTLNGDNLKKVGKSFEKIVLQTKEFLRNFHKELDKKELREIHFLCDAFSGKGLSKIIKCFRLGYRFKFLYMNIAFLLWYFSSESKRCPLCIR